MRARAIVLDIEGTTTSIRFVYDTLFPFVREHVASYIERAWTDPEVQADVEALRAQAREDLESGLEGTPQIPKDADTVTIRGATLANPMADGRRSKDHRAQVTPREDLARWLRLG